jgi:hypothetical protein
MLRPAPPRRRFWSSALQGAGIQPLTSKKRIRPIPPRLEALEDRTLPNTAPVLSLSQTAFNVVKTTTLSVTASATDKDSGETLTFSLVNAPAGASITSTQVSVSKGSAATGTLTWTPTEDQGPTSYTFTIKVTDNGKPNLSAQQDITVTTLAAGLVGNNLLIVGTSGNDTASVSAPSTANAISVTVNGNTTGPFTVPSGGQILAKLYAGNDTFTLNESSVLVGPALVVDGGTGSNALVDNGTSNADTFTVTGSKVSLTGAGDLSYSNFQSLAVNTLGGNDSVTLTGLNSATATTITGGGGTDSFTGSVTGSLSGTLTIAGFQNATMSASGDFDSTFTVNSPGGLQQFSVGGTVSAASVINASTISNVSIGTLAGKLTATAGSVIGTTITTVASTGVLQATEVTGVTDSGLIKNTTITTLSGSLLAGSFDGLSIKTVTQGAVIKAAGQGTTSDVSIGTLSGSFTAPEDTSAPAGTTTGMMSGTTIDTVTSTGSVSTGSISGMSIGTQAGSVTAAGQGTTSNVSIGTLSGSFTAPEDTTAPAGTTTGMMSGTTVDTVTSTGSVSTGSISGMSIGTQAGSVTAAGQGTTSNVSIGTLSGSFTAPEDTTAPAGTTTGMMSGTTIDTVTSTGSVSTGSISGMSIGTQAGSVTAAGQGTTSNVSIGTLSGSFTAPEDTSAPAGTTTGMMSGTTVDTVTSTGSVSTGSISGMSIGTQSGSVTAAGQGTTSNVSIGTLSGSFTAPEDTTAPAGTTTGMMSGTTIDTVTSTGSVSTGSISGMSIGTQAGSVTAAGQGKTSNVSIGTLSGSFKAPQDTTSGSGVMTSSIFGTVTSTGIIFTGTISGMSVGTDAGSITALNTMSSVAAATLQASLTAGHFNIVTAKHASPMIQFVEPTVTRTIEMTSHVPNGATTGGTLSDYGFYYDGTGSGDPQVVIQVASATSGVGYDLSLLTDTVGTAGKGFDLEGLYVASGQAGIHNVVVGGDLAPGAVSSAALTFFGLASTTPAGIQLSQDNLAVAVAGNAPAASINAKTIQAIAAGSFAGVSADNAGNSDAFVPLTSSTAVTQANDNYQVFVGEGTDVAQFLVTGSGSSFDNKSMLFADSVADHRPITASDVLVSSGTSSDVSEVDFTGKGGSLTTPQPILSAIKGASGASLGNLILSAPGGITANITADSIIGNIDGTNGGISGTIRTTVGDLGSASVDSTGKITGVTYIHAGGGGLTSTGKIISAGNLVSQLNLKSGMDGVVAVAGDIGVIQLDSSGHAPSAPNALTRFGGIVVSTGGLNGQVVALGNIFGDISVSGGLSGRIAAHGREEFNLSSGVSFSRTGILGNVSIGGGISSTGAIVSLGLLGDDGSDNIKNDTAGTHLTISGTDKGIIAAAEDINFGSTGTLNQGGIFENVGPGDSSTTASNANVIDWIFTDGGTALTIPGGLSKILTDLGNLTVTNGKLTGTVR